MATFETYYYEAYEEHSATGNTMFVKSWYRILTKNAK